MTMDLVWPMLGSLIAGALIGLEREFRGRPAGFRTHILVCLASALLMLAASRQDAWNVTFIPGENIITDPTRMAHGILTGIGFLCAGVIFRQGFSIHGLTTAASLWITAAIGILFGVGMIELGAAATGVSLAVLGGLRWLDGRVPSRTAADVRIRYLREKALDEVRLRALFAEFGLRINNVGHRLTDGGRIVEHLTKVRSSGRVQTDRLAAKLRDMPEVLEYDVTPHDD